LRIASIEAAVILPETCIQDRLDAYFTPLIPVTQQRIPTADLSPARFGASGQSRGDVLADAAIVQEPAMCRRWSPNTTASARRPGSPDRATPICAEGHGYPRTPGIHTPEQVAGWKQVTEAVHGAGGKIALQLWHVGRISHPDLQPGGALPVAPSAIRPAGQVFTGQAMKDYVTPRALDLSEIPALVAKYAQAARGAMEAGFDGVEIHAGNGYLLDQFLRSSTNQRSDAYGGSKTRAPAAGSAGRGVQCNRQ
jgi:hypothetical protein